MEFTSSAKKSDEIVKPSTAPKFNMNMMVQQGAGKQQVNNGGQLQPQLQQKQQQDALSPTFLSPRVNGKPQQQPQQIIQQQYQQPVQQFQQLGQQQQVGQLTLQQKIHQQLQQQQQQMQQQQQPQQTIQLQSQQQTGPYRLSSPYKPISVQQQQLPSREVQMLKAPLRPTSPVRTVTQHTYETQTQNSFHSPQQQRASSPRIQMNTFTQGFNIHQQPKQQQGQQQIPLQPQQYLLGQPRQTLHSLPQRIELLNNSNNLPKALIPSQTPQITVLQQQQQQDDIAGKMAAMDHKVSTLVSEINSLQILVIKKNKEAKYWKGKYDAIDQNIVSFLSDEDHNKRGKKESPEKGKQSEHIDESEEDQQQDCSNNNNNNQKLEHKIDDAPLSLVEKLQKQLKEQQQSLFDKEVNHKEQTDGLQQLLKQKDDYLSEYAKLNEELLKRIEAMGNNNNNNNNNNATQNSSSSIQSQQQHQETQEQFSKQEKLRLSVNSQGKSTNRRSVELSSGLALQAARIKLLESDLALKESANKSLEVENRQLNAQIHSLQTQINQLTQRKASEKIASLQNQQQQLQFPSLITQSTGVQEINGHNGRTYQQEFTDITSVGQGIIIGQPNKLVSRSDSQGQINLLKQQGNVEISQIEQWQQQQQKLKELVNHNNFMNNAAFGKIEQQQSTTEKNNENNSQQQLQSVEQRLKQFSSFLSSIQGTNTKNVPADVISNTKTTTTMIGLTAPIQEQSKSQSISQYLTQQKQDQTNISNPQDQLVLSSSSSSLSPLEMLFQKKLQDNSSEQVQKEFNYLSPVGDYIPYSSRKNEPLKIGS